MPCYFCDSEADHEIDGMWLCHNCALAYLNDPAAKRLMQEQLQIDAISQKEINLADMSYRADLMGMSDGPW